MVLLSSINTARDDIHIAEAMFMNLPESHSPQNSHSTAKSPVYHLHWDFRQPLFH